MPVVGVVGTIGLSVGDLVGVPLVLGLLLGVVVVGELTGFGDGLPVAGVDVTGAAVLANAVGFVVVGLDV